MKNILKIFACVFLSSTLISCSEDSKGDEGKEAAQTCQYPASGLGRTISYGDVLPEHDNCHNFDGAVSRWTGMVEPVALIHAPTVFYQSGLVCNQCFRLSGLMGARIGRVIAECPACNNDEISIDGDSFQALTGAPNNVGTYDLVVTSIPCPTSENIKVHANVGSTAFNLSVNVSNHTSPIKKVEVNNDTSFQNMPRLGDSGDFSAVLANPATNPVQIRLTDIFDQVVTGAVNPTSGTATTIPTQFGDCR